MLSATKLARRSKVTGTVLALLAAVVVLSAAAVMGTTSAHHEGDNAVHACVNSYTGQIRIITTGTCAQSEREVDLAEAGVASDVVVINDENSPVPVAGNVEVKNDEGNPLPVSGQVQAQQSGDWTVSLEGSGLTSDLPVITKSFNDTYYLDPVFDPVSVDVTLPELINASQVIVTSSDDSLTLTLMEGSKTWAKLGTIYTDVPDVMSLPLTERVPVDRFIVYCGNLIQDCEVTVTILGN